MGLLKTHLRRLTEIRAYVQIKVNCNLVLGWLGWWHRVQDYGSLLQDQVGGVPNQNLNNTNKTFNNLIQYKIFFSVSPLLFSEHWLAQNKGLFRYFLSIIIEKKKSNLHNFREKIMIPVKKKIVRKFWIGFVIIFLKLLVLTKRHMLYLVVVCWAGLGISWGGCGHFVVRLVLCSVYRGRLQILSGVRMLYPRLTGISLKNDCKLTGKLQRNFFKPTKRSLNSRWW